MQQSDMRLFHPLCPRRFLADLMDGTELIRNVTLCGHLHHGKVSCSSLASAGSLTSCSVICWGIVLGIWIKKQV